MKWNAVGTRELDEAFWKCREETEKMTLEELKAEVGDYDASQWDGLPEEDEDILDLIEKDGTIKD